MFSSSISANLGNSGEAMVEIPQVLEEETNWALQEVFTLQGERHCTYYQQQGGELYRYLVNFGRENTAVAVAR